MKMSAVNTLKNLFCSILIYIFNCLPLNNRKVFLFSYYGDQYGCNPKYMTEHLLAHYPENTFDIVWAFNEPDAKQCMQGIRKVKIMSLRYFYELCTSKIVVTNFRTTDLFVKRKHQYYIQTWHSSLRLKQIEKDVINSLPQHYITMAKKDSRKCDLLLSGCQYSTEIFKRAFWYAGEIFEHGTPRNDVLIQNNSTKKAEIKADISMPEQSKILLYAPTFRKNNNLAVYDMDYDQLLLSLTRRFGGKWVILVKLHPHLAAKSKQMTTSEHVMDVSAYDDMQELLLITDILISDYSSLIFDFSITNRPCFLYVPDLEIYTNQDRKLYFNVSELPFKSATSNQSLCEKIEQFNELNYRKHLKDFLDGIGTYEKGTAAAHIAERMHTICFRPGRSERNEAI